MMHMVRENLTSSIDNEILLKLYSILFKGRQYPYDLVGKAFSTLPFQNKHTNELLANFDLLYEIMTQNVSRLSDERPNSPGIYICSTDILLLNFNNGTTH